MVVSTSVYMLKIIFKINININKLISILRKENIYGACPCIISKLPYRFIITRELYLLTEIFILIETLIKLCLHKQPTEVFYKKSFRPATSLKRGPSIGVSCEYSKIFKNISFEEHLRTTASAFNLIQNNLSYRIL